MKACSFCPNQIKLYASKSCQLRSSNEFFINLSCHVQKKPGCQKTETLTGGKRGGMRIERTYGSVASSAIGEKWKASYFQRVKRMST